MAAEPRSRKRLSAASAVCRKMAQHSGSLSPARTTSVRAALAAHEAAYSSPEGNTLWHEPLSSATPAYTSCEAEAEA